jgi:hypothetical protein
VNERPGASAEERGRSGQPSFERRVWNAGEIGPERLARAHEILQASFPRWPPFEVPVAPIDHLRWKLDHPGWAPASLVGEMVDGVMAGVNLRLHRRFRVGGIVREARDWVDQCLHPDYQERGIYGRLAASWPEQRGDYDLGVWSTRHPKVVAATRVGPTHLEIGDRIRGWILPLGSAEALATRGGNELPAWSRTALSRVAVAASRIRRTGRVSGSWPAGARVSVRAIERFDDRVSALVESFGRQFDLVQERTPAFLRWRYGDPRGGRFQVLGAEREGELAGYVAVKTSEGLAYVMDLVAAPESQAGDELLAAAVTCARAAGADAVVCRLPVRHPSSALLPRHGFVNARLRMGYSVSSGRSPMESLSFLGERSARLHLMLGDVDWS